MGEIPDATAAFVALRSRQSALLPKHFPATAIRRANPATVHWPLRLKIAAHPEYLRGIVHDGHRGSVSPVSAQSALIMNGTFEPVVTAQWIDEVMSDLVAPTLGGG